ncbi:hypothetical protein HHK36_004365 [Tetracentron sinense]|uniref:Fe2OG dioxygenase domain-containing protein n=1 Tax=Tetracentron sinense TaxID=13715 RepID=A0A834ZR18_TETSI|nr:hypothetical protein HHK36_004365 [Tetracentron sinense]
MGVERVQAIASLSMSMDTIPSEFIRSEKEQPARTTYNGPVPEIPAIDLSDPDQEKLRGGGSDESSSNSQKKRKKPMLSLLELRPWREMELCCRKKLKERKLGYHLFHKIWPPPSINYQFWPKNPPSYREANEEYAKCMGHVVDKIFTSLSLGLGLEGNVLREAAGGNELEYLLKINYYPPCPRPDLALGVVAHTNMSTLTILVPNEVPGLQVFKDNRWFDANYITNALVVHIGDQIQGVLHRTTVNKEKTRMSWPVFFEPPSELVVGPLPQLVNEENPIKHKTKKYKEYVHCKLNKLPQ